MVKTQQIHKSCQLNVIIFLPSPFFANVRWSIKDSVDCASLIWKHGSHCTIMPTDLSGNWELESNEFIENYLKALDIDFPVRKVASHLSPNKIIIQDGDNFVIKTHSTFKTYEFSFTVGVETDEFTKGLDNRMLKTVVTWEGEKLVARQKGEKANRGWKHWILGDKLYLELTCEDALCYKVYRRKS
ncbi:retinol-binding protein 2 [Misgurnus anguillicaudatus]|uniref:retinol-binding protein 2 n=1 Tax=Misgurnus anguillicaudatus TaxID=75329 RepID=UPI003CCFADB8